MKLQTHIPLEPSKNQFGYDDALLLLGSCFAENIWKKLDFYKFHSITNPFGIIFNPIAIERLIEDAILDKTYKEEDVFEYQGIWKSFVAHSELNALSRLEIVIKLQEAQQLLRNYLKKSSHLFITLGSAWVYKHIKTNMIVANCHKVPQKEFSKELLSVGDVLQSLSKICRLVSTFNPAINITFTVSPVRHIKDGIVENSLSKSHLIAAVHQLVNGNNIQYFPSYEILMDELRDYRFYKSDMLHPSDQAVDYVWERFVEVYAFAKAKEILKKVTSIQNRLNHKPFNPESAAHKDFIERMQEDMRLLQEEYPLINF